VKARFLKWCEWLRWGALEFGRGIDIDQDGGIEGSGFLFRLEPPRWLRHWAARRLPPPTEQEMFARRQDISDILVASLISRATLTMPEVADGPLKMTWTNDALEMYP
jgi:hypothetical protein